MPDISWNVRFWRDHQDWSQEGDEWSSPWGSPAAQWYGAVLPRLRDFLPAARVVELAPGYGRWTQFLANLSASYLGIDVSQNCVEHCRRRFPAPHMTFHVNDGIRLDVVPRASADLVFSFDSLVHVDANVLAAYVSQIPDKLTHGGVAFLHHSNLKALAEPPAETHARDPGVSAELIKAVISHAGGDILRQEILTWGESVDLDCLTLFCRAGAYDVPSETLIVNRQFMEEAAHIRRSLAPWHFVKS